MPKGPTMFRERDLTRALHGARPAKIAPRGLNREEAADYIGVGHTKFDEMVADGRMPKPIHVDGRRLWDRRALDQSFDALGTSESVNPWNQVED
jgi:hypothetical protein